MRGRFTALMLLVHLLAVALLIHVIVRCFGSLRRGRRIQEAVIYLSKEPGDEKLPVLYWENSIGREKTCDILLSDAGVSRDHAVLKRREGGWIIADTNSRAGTFVNERKIASETPVRRGAARSDHAGRALPDGAAEKGLPRRQNDFYAA